MEPLQLALCSCLLLLLMQLAFPRTGTSPGKNSISVMRTKSQALAAPLGSPEPGEFTVLTQEGRLLPVLWGSHAAAPRWGKQASTGDNTAHRCPQRVERKPHHVLSSLCTEKVLSRFSNLLREGLLYIIRLTQAKGQDGARKALSEELMSVIRSTKSSELPDVLGPVQGMGTEMSRTLPCLLGAHRLHSQPPRPGKTCHLDQDTKHRHSEHG